MDGPYKILDREVDCNRSALLAKIIKWIYIFGPVWAEGALMKNYFNFSKVLYKSRT